MSVPDLTRKVIGYRGWRLEDGQLQPQNSVLPAWKVGVNHAACDKHRFHSVEYCDDCVDDTLCEEAQPQKHIAPDPECECGYYALHEITPVDSWSQSAGLRMMGAVTAWGRLEVHPEGFRAEYAQPVAFAYDDSFTLRQHREAGKFARQHGIRYMPTDELEEFARAFGDVVPEELRPARLETTFRHSFILNMKPLPIGSTYLTGGPVSWQTTNIGFSWAEQDPLLPKEGELSEALGLQVELAEQAEKRLATTTLQEKIIEGIHSDYVKRLLNG